MEIQATATSTVAAAKSLYGTVFQLLEKLLMTEIKFY